MRNTENEMQMQFLVDDPQFKLQRIAKDIEISFQPAPAFSFHQTLGVDDFFFSSPQGNIFSLPNLYEISEIHSYRNEDQKFHRGRFFFVLSPTELAYDDSFNHQLAELNIRWIDPKSNHSFEEQLLIDVPEDFLDENEPELSPSIRGESELVAFYTIYEGINQSLQNYGQSNLQKSIDHLELLQTNVWEWIRTHDSVDRVRDEYNPLISKLRNNIEYPCLEKNLVDGSYQWEYCR